MCAFRDATEEVPEHIWVFQVGSGVSFLGMDEIWELDSVSYEKDWGVVTYHIPIAFFGIKFQGESSRVPLCVG